MAKHNARSWGIGTNAKMGKHGIEATARPERNSVPYGARVGMEPFGFQIACELPGGETFDIVTPGWLADVDDPRAYVQVSFDGEVLEIDLTPREAFTIEMCRIDIRHAFTHDERVLLNGYQSWTDTVERSPWTRMRGLAGISRAVIDMYSLDGGGDYRFTSYSLLPGKQHGWTYATFRRGEGMVLVASLCEDDGFTYIGTDAAAGVVSLRPGCPKRLVEIGERIVLGRFAIVRGLPDECYDRWFELSGIKARTQTPLVGYCSWYRHYGDIDEKSLLDDLAGEAQVFSQIESEFSIRGGKHSSASVPFTKLFQIDDGYCKVGDWLDVDSAKFPHGLAPLAKAASDAGFVPGLWVSPFVCERDSKLFKERNDWLLRDSAGNLVSTGCQWSGGFALDTRNPEVRSYVLHVLQTITGEWGFKLLKVDFLYAACLVSHDGLNRGQLMADALDLVRLGAGEDCLILGCGVPLGVAFGRVDYCRIGCDVGLDWDDAVHMRILHRERVSTKNSLANTYGRAPLDGRAFGNDPDVFFLRDGMKLADMHRYELLFANADMGSVLLTSDDMGQWSPDKFNLYRMALRLLCERKGLL